MVLFGLTHRVLAAWEDKRYLVEENMGRMTDCKSTDVRWTEPSQFWLPTFFVVDVLEMVSGTFCYGYHGCKKNTLQGGYLHEPEKPGTAGNRLLWYDVADGSFWLAMFSYGKIHCPMDFTFYPFDTQMCKFVMHGPRNASFEVKFDIKFMVVVNAKCI